MAADPRRRSTVATEAILGQLNAEVAAHGHSIKAIAALCGYDYNTFRRWMKGEREIPLTVLLDVLQTIHLEPSVFFARARARETGR
jgi:hypothetical protein